ncbi:unnamed protein product [Cylicocyclus nassatus]|uniref:Uncharacterized protein n=1 Tax=Cylicocyclus nassatus TaxID=53992 RepID=A0AA36GTQ1_CYLNA|nr:unnamed protein product [Cylicocyclus nassatus]
MFLPIVPHRDHEHLRDMVGLDVITMVDQHVPEEDTSPTSSAFCYSQPYRNERFMRDTSLTILVLIPSTSQMHESTGYEGTRRR